MKTINEFKLTDSLYLVIIKNSNEVLFASLEFNAALKKANDLNTFDTNENIYVVVEVNKGLYSKPDDFLEHNYELN